MAHIHELIRQVEAKDADLAARLKREFDALANRRAFGLNFERHTPEAVDLPGRPVRRGDKVHVLPPRGETVKAENKILWVVTDIDRDATPPVATLMRDVGNDVDDECQVIVEDLVVVAEFRDPIYPGLVSTGSVERGGDKPFHSVINGENFHVLQALLFTHHGKVDAIYIDPPYNTGARDWKYNNDYVEAEDHYRHSKWLAFMERRLLLAKKLLNPDDSVLIVTIDEKEYLRLGLLLEQVFANARIQMISATISPRGTSRFNEFSRVDEYVFYVFIGDAGPVAPPGSGIEEEVRMPYLRRTSANSTRDKGRPQQFYPIYVDPKTHRIAKIGEPIAQSVNREDVECPADMTQVWPINPDGIEMTWGMVPDTLRRMYDSGYVRVTPGTTPNSPYVFPYVTTEAAKKVETGEYIVRGTRADGSKIVCLPNGKSSMPTTAWRDSAHDAGAYGTALLKSLIPQRSFPFPKSLYAVEDALRYVVWNKPQALIVDFFSGSGTTAHATFRLNHQYGGSRTCISVTNNEVSAEEQKTLRAKRLRPGDDDWEALGICDYVTKPRIRAAIEGKTPGGQRISGDYKFTDEFPMADGFEENVQFFTLTYETPLGVTSGRAFERIAPLLWVRAGSIGRIIEKIDAGWDVAESYGVLIELDNTPDFIAAISAKETVTHAFIVTDEDRLFEAVVRELPSTVEPVRLYDAYLRNSEFEAIVSSL